jgi:ribosomal protein L7/L12
MYKEMNMFDTLFTILPLLAPLRETVGDRNLAAKLRELANILDYAAKANQELNEYERSFLPHNKIGAIKAVRERLQIGLKDAKDMVDAFSARV